MGESSEAIRQRVQAARDIQRERFSNIGSSDIVCNADMRVVEIRQFCRLSDEGQRPMRAAMSQLNLSALVYMVTGGRDRSTLRDRNSVTEFSGEIDEHVIMQAMAGSEHDAT